MVVDPLRESDHSDLLTTLRIVKLSAIMSAILFRVIRG